jgi:hypothetical protein
VESFVCVYPA